MNGRWLRRNLREMIVAQNVFLWTQLRTQPPVNWRERDSPMCWWYLFTLKVPRLQCLSNSHRCVFLAHFSSSPPLPSSHLVSDSFFFCMCYAHNLFLFDSGKWPKKLPLKASVSEHRKRTQEVYQQRGTSPRFTAFVFWLPGKSRALLYDRWLKWQAHLLVSTGLLVTLEKFLN